jgi:hypothetical protein
MKRLVLLVGVLAVFLAPASALAFHHGGLPARFCASEAAGSPSNDNGTATRGYAGQWAGRRRRALREDAGRLGDKCG